MSSQITVRIPLTAQPHTQAKRFHIEVTSDLLDDDGSLLNDLLAFGLDTVQAEVLDLRVVPSDNDCVQ